MSFYIYIKQKTNYIMTKQDALAQTQELVTQFLANRHEYIRGNSTYNETLLRTDFLNPFLEILGWDVNNRKQLPQGQREVVHEDTVVIEDDEHGINKKPDYSLRLGAERKFFVEAKKPSVDISQNRSAAFQVRRYGWNARLPISVLSNFDKLVIYDCQPRPQVHDDVRVARLKVYDCTEYVEKFDEIYHQLSRESVYSGEFDQVFPLDRDIDGSEPFDKYFLEQIQRWRIVLSRQIVEQNAGLSNDEINFLVQRLINRIVFLRICEDRSLEKYRSLQQVESYNALKTLFLRADQRYNSGLFDFIEDKLSLSISIPDETVISIFKELYYPESPYAFSVVEASVLGEIYEYFLAKEIQIAPEIRIVEKPEVIAAGGVISTPKYIVDDIVGRTLHTPLSGKSPSELSNFSVADIACGSGTFLLQAFEYLINHYLEWYLLDGADKHRDRIWEGAHDQWYLSLVEKQRILSTHLFGVDIDHQAVEVCRFSLLLKVIENENSSSIDAHLQRYKQRALPNLKSNIIWGNSLVDDTFFDFNPDAAISETLVKKVNPLNWRTTFPHIHDQGGFDAIVGNPPYVRIQNTMLYSPEEALFYQSDFSPFSTSKSDNFDKYSLFIERALSLIKPSGRVGYIVPNKFFSTRAGGALRLLLTEQNHLAEITHFGVEQVFGKHAITYTSIIILNKGETPQFWVEHVSNLEQWKHGLRNERRLYDAAKFDGDSWVFVSPQAEELFARLKRENPATLESVAEILVGVQTSADPVYIIRRGVEDENVVTFQDRQHRTWSIEKAIVRPCIYKARLGAFSTVKANAHMIYPYEVIDGVAVLYSPEDMATQFPLCWAYLSVNEEQLRKRDVQGWTEETWYRFGRSQSLTKFEDGQKLIWSTLTLVPRYAFDTQKTMFTGGGNGPYYGLRMRPESQLSIHYIQAILSHPIVETIVSSGASSFQHGYRSHGKQFVKDVPIRVIDFSEAAEKTKHDAIVNLVIQLIDVTEKLTHVTLPHQKDILERQAQLLRTRINRLVEDLYGITQPELLALPELVTTRDN